MPLNTRGLMPSIDPYQITGPPGFDPATGLMADETSPGNFTLRPTTAGLSPSVRPATGPQPPTLEQPNKNAWILPLLGAIIGKTMGKPLLGFAMGAQGAAAQQAGIESRNDKAVREGLARQAQDRADQQAKSLEDQRKAGIRTSAIDVALKAGGAAAVAFAHSNGIMDMDPQLNDIETAQSKKEAATRALHETDDKAQAQREKDKADAEYRKAIDVAKIMAESREQIAGNPKAMSDSQLLTAQRSLISSYVKARLYLDPGDEALDMLKGQVDNINAEVESRPTLRTKNDNATISPFIAQKSTLGPWKLPDNPITTGLSPDNPLAAQADSTAPPVRPTQAAPAGTTTQGMGGTQTPPSRPLLTDPKETEKAIEKEKKSILDLHHDLSRVQLNNAIGRLVAKTGADTLSAIDMLKKQLTIR